MKGNVRSLDGPSGQRLHFHTDPRVHPSSRQSQHANHTQTVNVMTQKTRQLCQAVVWQAWTNFDNFGQQHQHTFKNDIRVQLSLSLHFYLLYLLLNSCDENDVKQRVFLGRQLVALKRAGCVMRWLWKELVWVWQTYKEMQFCLHACT